MDPDPNCDLQEIVIIFEKEMLTVGILLDSMHETVTFQLNYIKS